VAGGAGVGAVRAARGWAEGAGPAGSTGAN